MEKTISTKRVFDGKVIRIDYDEVELDDGTRSFREVVNHNGGACIALKDKDNKFFMVKQYRYALKKEMYEFCAGKIEKDENPDEAIKRECVEELGYSCKNVKKFNYVVPTCGYDNEKIHLYYGEVDEKLSQNFDEDERIEVYKFTFDEINEMILNGVIDDAKTIVLMYRIKMEGLDK